MVVALVLVVVAEAVEVFEAVQVVEVIAFCDEVVDDVVAAPKKMVNPKKGRKRRICRKYDLSTEGFSTKRIFGFGKK